MRPEHYRPGPYETIKVIDAWDLNFNLGNVVKYVSRAGRKADTNPIEDLQKARQYLDFEIARRSGESVPEELAKYRVGMRIRDLNDEGLTSEFGTVVSLKNQELTIRWDNGRTLTYEIGERSLNHYEILP